MFMRISGRQIVECQGLEITEKNFRHHSARKLGKSKTKISLQNYLIKRGSITRNGLQDVLKGVHQGSQVLLVGIGGIAGADLKEGIYGFAT